MSLGALYVVSGPSGAGKSTVCMTSSACIGQITGLGKFGYILAVVYLIEYYNK